MARMREPRSILVISPYKVLTSVHMAEATERLKQFQNIEFHNYDDGSVSMTPFHLGILRGLMKSFMPTIRASMIMALSKHLPGHYSRSWVVIMRSNLHMTFTLIVV